MRMAMTFHPIHHHLLAAQIKDLITGHHMIVTDFLFCRNQISAGDINFLLSLWAASLATHGDKPPFSKATDMYNTIDSTPLGNAAWE
jgi:hypothetical protein